MYSENYRIPEKEVEEDKNNWKYILYTWIERNSIINMSILPKQSIDSMQFLLKYQMHISQTQSTYSKNLHRTEKYPESIHLFKNMYQALAGVAQWIECQPTNQRVTGSIPSQGTCLGCRPGPQQGAGKKQPHIDVSPSLSPSLLLSLKIKT